VSQHERNYRVRVRSNITRALTALDLTTVSDIQQMSAALAQCTVSGSRLRGGGKHEIKREKNRKSNGKPVVSTCVCFPGGESRVHLRGVSEQHLKQAGVHAGDSANRHQAGHCHPYRNS